MRRQQNTHVSIYYEGSFPDGEVFDSRREGEPLDVLLGSLMIPRGLENAIFEMEDGEERTVRLSPDEAYGSHDPDAVFKVPLNMLPNPDELPVGEYIYWHGETKKNLRPVPAKVVEVTDTYAIIDLNHPLVGKELVYWVKVVG